MDLEAGPTAGFTASAELLARKNLGLSRLSDGLVLSEDMLSSLSSPTFCVYPENTVCKGGR